MSKESDQSMDPVIHIEFGPSRSKYFDDAAATAREAAKESNADLSTDGSSREYDLVTSDPEKAKRVWTHIQNWKSSELEVKSNLLDYRRSNAAEEDLRELEYEIKRKELVESIDFDESDQVIEVRFGPSSSKYIRNAVGKPSQYALDHEKSEYRKL